MAEPHEEITSLLRARSAGDLAAEEKLMPLIYDELRQLARSRLDRDNPDQTIEPTGLVHLAYARVFGSTPTEWDDRAHFFGAAALAMRRILVERARAAQRAKRGGGRRRLTFDEADFREDPADSALLALDDALGDLKRLDARKHDVVHLRYFVGLSVDDCARALGISATTVKADWSFAKAWLQREIEKASA